MSHGKDSQALLLKMIELGYPIDDVVFFYMKGAEFSAIERLSIQTEKMLASLNIKYTRLEPEHDFSHYATCEKVNKRNGCIQNGYQWCGGMCRWGTGLKIKAMEKYYRETYPDEVIVQYIGIAADERHRIDRKRYDNTIKIYPLVELGMTENDCLEYCYSNGIFWEESGYRLYDLLDRVSCKYCRNKNLRELYNIYRYLPEVWDELKVLQDSIRVPYRNGLTVHDLEKRFKNNFRR